MPLDRLPIELVVHVFSLLACRDLLACSLVSRLFRAAIQQSACCQYTIELAASGMHNGPPSVLCHADRLAMLRNSQAAWQSLQWTALQDVHMLQGSLYELYGGVLVQSTHKSGCGLVFRRLPSLYRGIPEHVWSLDLDFAIQDFTLDPAQDLLALIAQPHHQSNLHDARIEVFVHLRSLSTGGVHPLATKSPVLVHGGLRTTSLTFMIQVHSDRVAVQFVNRGMALSELVVWNWKTGETLLNTHGQSLMAFAFLTERFILVGGFGDTDVNVGQPRLFAVDLDASDGERSEFEDVEYLCSFLYPACYPWVHPLSFLIRSDPCSDWFPHPGVQVPFSIGSGPRLYVVTIWVMQGEAVTPIDLFVLSHTLLAHIDSLGADETRHDFEWHEWGPDGTRMVAQAAHSHVWVCYVFGTRFSSVTGGEQRRELEVWDFNPPGTKRGRGSSGVEWHVGDTTVLRGRVFVGEVRTRLPYRVSRRRLAAPSEGQPVFTAAMCSEDSVILVDSRGRRFRILTF